MPADIYAPCNHGAMAVRTFEDVRVFGRCPYAYRLDRTEAFPDKITLAECIEISVKEAVGMFTGIRVMHQRLDTDRVLERFWERWDANASRIYDPANDDTMLGIRMGEKCIRNFVEMSASYGAADIVASGMTGTQKLPGGKEIGVCIEEVGRRGSTVFLTKYVISPELLSREELGKDLDMRVSALWAMDNLGTTAIVMRWAFLLQRMVTQLSADRSSCMDAAKATSGMLEEMESDKEPLPRESDYCGSCPYQSRCLRFLHELATRNGADEGTALADEYLELEAKKRALRNRIELLDAKQDALKARIVAFSDANGYMALKGTEGKLLVRHERKAELPSDKTALIARLRETGQYDSLSIPNYSRIRSDIVKGTADPEIIAMSNVENIDKIYVKKDRREMPRGSTRWLRNVRLKVVYTVNQSRTSCRR